MENKARIIHRSVTYSNRITYLLSETPLSCVTDDIYFIIPDPMFLTCEF